jgi:translation initiation factor IF-3
LLRLGEIRVINEEGTLVGIMTARKALNLAREDGLDLVLVTDSSTPPVCRIADYGKMKYLESKRKRENHKKVQETKGLKISPRISDHDLGITQRKANEFLKDGNKVKVTCQFRKRELAHPELGMDRLNRLAEALLENGVLEIPPALEGRAMSMLIRPK